MSAAFVWDMPYGYDLFTFDKQLVMSELTKALKQFDALQSQDHYIALLMHKPEDTNMVTEALRDRQYQHIDHLFWYKPGHQVSGPVKSYTNAVEMMTIGFYKDRNSVNWNVDADPLKRHNLIQLPPLTTLTKDSNGQPINVTEKPPGVVEWVLRNHCPPGSTVMIAGTGAGGDVKGAIQAGLNVVGVEVDEKMYKASLPVIAKFIQEMDAEPEEIQGSLDVDDEVKVIEEWTAEVNWSPEKGRKKGAVLVACDQCGYEITAEQKESAIVCKYCEDSPLCHDECLKAIPGDADKGYVCIQHQKEHPELFK